MADPTHPLILAINPLISRIGATVIDPFDLRRDDVPLTWNGELVAGIRLTATSPTGRAAGNTAGRAAGNTAGRAAGNTAGRAAGGTAEAGVGMPTPEPPGGLDRILAGVESQIGTPLAELDRTGKQRAVRMLEEGGAFSHRKSVEAVAAALEVSRFTVYNYLNRDRE